MKNERKTEASKSIKFLKVCHNKWLIKRRVFQVATSSEELLLFCPMAKHIITTYLIFSYFHSRFFKAGITALLTQYFRPFSSQKRRQSLASVHQAVCTHTNTRSLTWCCTDIYIHTHMHIQR